MEFTTEAGETWVGNFRPGFYGIDDVRQHPEGHNVLVVAAGAIWVVDPDRRHASEVGGAVDALWPVADPEGVVMNMQGLALVRLGPAGRVWHTRRISWDGLKQIQVSDAELTGLAWSPFGDEWVPFAVDLRSGQVRGGSYHEPDAQKWEVLTGGRSG